MSKPTDDRTARDADRDEQAAAWVVRMASDQRTRADEEAFEHWLADKPANADAYDDHRILWDGMADLGDDEDARAILGVNRLAARTPWFGVSRRSVLVGSSVAAAAVAAGVVALPLFRGEGYETGPGEQRRIVLADGSSVMLNTQSRLRVAFGERERHIVLEKGQAYFDVAKDAARPFRVFAGRDEIRAIGTAFDVRLDGEEVRVVLEEGIVALFRAKGERLVAMPGGVGGIPSVSRSDRPLAVMRAGQQARLQPAVSPAVDAVDIPRAQAWRFGQMILDEARLGDAIEDMNRYGGRRIVLAEPDMANLKISGVFHTKRPEAFVDGVTAALGVHVASEDSTMILLGPAEDRDGK
jgi:transmembrane sensor